MVDIVNHIDSSSSDESDDEEWLAWRLQEGQAIKIAILKPTEVKEATILNSERILEQVNVIKREGHRLLQEKQYSEAIMRYKQALDSLPSSSLSNNSEEFFALKEAILVNQIYCYYKLKDKPTVMTQCQEGLKFFPNSSKLNYYYGLAQQEDDSVFKKIFYSYGPIKKTKKKKQKKKVKCEIRSLLYALISTFGLSLISFIIFNKIKSRF